jgi:hypothetical protein
MDNVLEKQHAILMTEFDRYVREHPRFAAKIPRNAQVVLQIEGDEHYNAWSRELARKQREPEQPVIYVCAQGLKPVRSRIIRPILTEAPQT